MYCYIYVFKRTLILFFTYILLKLSIIIYYNKVSNTTAFTNMFNLFRSILSNYFVLLQMSFEIFFISLEYFISFCFFLYIINIFISLI